MTVRLVPRGDGKGHRLLRVDGDDVDAIGPRFVPVHRLACYAWGELDSLDDPLEVHHIDGAPSHNAETNLEALEPEDHAQITAEQVAERRAST